MEGTSPSNPVIIVIAKEGKALDKQSFSFLPPQADVTPLFINLPNDTQLQHKMARYYYISTPQENFNQLLPNLQNDPSVQAAFVNPGSTLAIYSVAELKAKKAPPPHATPDFTGKQGYLKSAPEGVDAFYAWKFPGGDGKDITVIDIEYSWNLKHEDLQENKLGVVVGTDSTMYRDHGTAVLGVFNGDRNTIGVTGIAPAAKAGCAVCWSIPLAQVIQKAADLLQPGEIILIEQQAWGPKENMFIPVEWYPDTLLAIQYATTEKRVVVVEAGANGGQDLDDAIYNTPLPGFPTEWKNPFNLANEQSGAVIVGAGCPPPGTNGNNGYIDRSRLFFSSYGTRLDCQGWGSDVTTTGYGDLQGGPNDENRHYTANFNGTSSASPVVAGTIACLQGILKGQKKPLLDSKTVAKLLRDTGSLQESAPGYPKTQRIGSRPNLVQLIEEVTRR